MPTNELARARVLQWMFFEQYRVEPNIATSRFWIHLLNAADRYAAQLAAKREPGLAALGVVVEVIKNAAEVDAFVQRHRQSTFPNGKVETPAQTTMTWRQ